jgi:hypothetical protein
MNLWFAPQISKHCPHSRPGRLIENLTWFSRPGVASIFTPSLGTVHECSTSAAVTVIRIGEFIGNTTLYLYLKAGMCRFGSLLVVPYMSRIQLL